MKVLILWQAMLLIAASAFAKEPATFGERGSNFLGYTYEKPSSGNDLWRLEYRRYLKDNLALKASFVSDVSIGDESVRSTDVSGSPHQNYKSDYMQHEEMLSVGILKNLNNLNLFNFANISPYISLDAFAGLGQGYVNEYVGDAAEDALLVQVGLRPALGVDICLWKAIVCGIEFGYGISYTNSANNSSEHSGTADVELSDFDISLGNNPAISLKLGFAF